jgi:hypothetical protein
MILAAIDPRIKLSFPAVMVSTAMQGGCTCENASLLRVDTGNIEFAALFAPKPQGMTSANDWTKEMSTKGFPELQAHYTLLGAPDNVMLHRGEHFPHNYNAVSRSAFYTWLNKHCKLGFNEPAIEHDYEPLSREQLTVWDAKHPAPKASDPDFERELLRWFAEDAEQQLTASAAPTEEFREVAGQAVEILIGRTIETAGDSQWHETKKHNLGTYQQRVGLVRNTTYREELPVIWLRPNEKHVSRAVIWLDDSGKSALYSADDSIKPAVQRLLNAGAHVFGADLLYQGEFLKDAQPLTQTRTVSNPRQFAGYTFGYNHSVFAQRVHDVLTLTRFLQHSEVVGDHGSLTIGVAGFDSAGPIVAAARAVAGETIQLAAVDTDGFRFARLLDYRDPQFLPGGAKYLDLPGLLALDAPQRLWLCGENAAPKIVKDFYESAGQTQRLTVFKSDDTQKEIAAAEWFLSSE